VGPAGCYNYPEWIATGDVNGDGKADIVATLLNNSATGCENNTVAVLTGLGTGKFKKPVYYSTGATAQSYEVFLSDLTGSGKPDIITSNVDGTISVLLNKGKGTFGPATLIASVAALNPHGNSLAIADFNGDGKADIAVATYGLQSAVYVLLGNGNGTFQAPITVAVPEYNYTYALAAGDFNKDGKMDLLVTLSGYCTSGYGYAAYAFLQGKGDGTFTAGPVNCLAGNYPMYPAVADLNGDGNLDAFIPLLQSESAFELGPALLEGNGDGTFNRIRQFYTGDGNPAAVIADFNGDGMPDIAAVNNDVYGGLNGSFVTVMQNSTQPVSVSPLNLNCGTVAVGSKKAETVILTNDQSTALAIDSVTVAGTDPGDFPAKSTCGSSVKGGWDCTITVTFTPAATGARTATLNIKDAVGTQTVQLSGSGK
jgi:hypothetical protein